MSTIPEDRNGPSLAVKLTLRPMTKLLNPLIMKLAGRRRFGMAAEIVHTGRRSGRRYATPVGARRTGDVIVIPMTFGARSDWARNVRAAGGCSIRLNGENYDVIQPEVLSRQDARPLIRSAFGPVERASFRMLGIRQYMRLAVAVGG